MNKITIIVIIALILAVVGGAVLYMSIINGDVPTEEAPRGGLFPFFGATREQDREQEAGEEGTAATVADRDGEFASAPVFRQLWDEPVAGATFAIDESGQTIVRFIERATGHLYEAYPTTTRVTRRTNTTLPRIQEVVWSSPDRLLIRYLREGDDVIETFSATIVLPERGTTTEERLGELRGQFLPQNITHVVAQNDTLFYLMEQGGGVRGVISAFDGSNAREIFSSPVRDWLPQWVHNNTVSLTTKAAADVPGHLFFLNTSSGSLEPVLSNIVGLTTNANTQEILYSEYRGAVPLLFSRDQARGSAVSLPVSTLTEKCVWSSADSRILYCATPKSFGGQTLPDAWYQGSARFDDEVWKIDTQTLSTKHILNPSALSTGRFDLTDVSVDEREENLLFRNRTDNTLWLYRLTDPSVQQSGDTQPTTNDE